MPIKSIADIELHGKRVLVREDLNLPIQNGNITNEARLHAAIPTLTYLLAEGASVMVASHLGRPTQPSAEFSLAPIAKRLGQIMNVPTRLVTDWAKPSYRGPSPGRIDVWENTRFEPGELTNDPELAKTMATYCDVFVMDAFATAHRAHASTCGVVDHVTTACAGPLLLKELKALRHFADRANPPLVAIVGGAKVSTKLRLLRRLIESDPQAIPPDPAMKPAPWPPSYSDTPLHLSDLQQKIKRVDTLIVGGGILNTCLAAQGRPIGASLHEPDLIHDAKELLSLATKNNVEFPLPEDVVVMPATMSLMNKAAPASSRVCAIDEVESNDKIVDIGPKSAQKLVSLVEKAHTVLWNGPLGVTEVPAFAQGTLTLANAIASSQAYSLAGGGDTLAAVDAFGLADKLSYCSTAGGAFLAFLEGNALPALQALESKG